jgi:hypothetical protein
LRALQVGVLAHRPLACWGHELARIRRSVVEVRRLDKQNDLPRLAKNIAILLGKRMSGVEMAMANC